MIELNECRVKSGRNVGSLCPDSRSQRWSWPGIAVRRTASLRSPMSRPSRPGRTVPGSVEITGTSPVMTKFEFSGEPKSGIVDAAFISPENVIAPDAAFGRAATRLSPATGMRCTVRRRNLTGTQKRTGGWPGSGCHGRYPLSDFDREGIGNVYGAPLNAVISQD